MPVKIFQLDWNLNKAICICFLLYLFPGYIYFTFQISVILKSKGENLNASSEVHKEPKSEAWPAGLAMGPGQTTHAAPTPRTCGGSPGTQDTGTTAHTPGASVLLNAK